MMLPLPRNTLRAFRIQALACCAGACLQSSCTWGFFDRRYWGIFNRRRWGNFNRRKLGNIQPALTPARRQHGTFDRAIEDTITALNTGCLRARDGTILQTANGKAYITNPAWREKLDTVVDILRAMRSRYDMAIKQGTLHLGHDDGRRQWYCINDRSLAVWMDETRAQAIDIIADLCNEAGVLPPHGPRGRLPRW